MTEAEKKMTEIKDYIRGQNSQIFVALLFCFTALICTTMFCVRYERINRYQESNVGGVYIDTKNNKIITLEQIHP